MNSERLREALQQRAPGQWELYRKRGRSRETVTTARLQSALSRDEEGCAARWFENGTLRFACASDAASLEAAMAESAALPQSATPSLEWPTGKNAPVNEGDALEAPPDLFQELARLLAAESRGEAALTQLTLRRGATVETIENARGLSVGLTTSRVDGVAHAVARRGTQACETRVAFRWDGEPNPVAVARRLCDGATLPLSGKTAPLARGEWLLEPSVAASMLAAIAPLFATARHPHWIHRSRFCAGSVTVVDDATADAAFDGEGTPTRRQRLVEEGHLLAPLSDLETAAASGGRSTGHGVRPSYRMPPAVSPRRLYLETASPVGPLDLLASVRRGLFASALTAPFWVDLDADRYEVEFTGVAILAGRAHAPVAAARARGRLSRLLQDIAGSATDRQFSPMPYPCGAPTLLIGRATFD